MTQTKQAGNSVGDKWIVVTTINPPTKAIWSLSNLASSGWSIVVVGDKKTPVNWEAKGIKYLSVDEQGEIYGDLAKSLIPYNHYCRKNLGYLYAIKNGAQCILETDDDNIPYKNFGEGIKERLTLKMVGGERWINIYKQFTHENIWPRGIPLDEISSRGAISSEVCQDDFPIQQYLADEDPDVDAIYRMVINKEVVFNSCESIGVEKNCWVPFNSQNTLFYTSAFPLLYLPCHVSFRMTDIWRSFVAQRALWMFNRKIAFHSSTVKQVRNQHDLMRDFADEVSGYLDNKKISTLLDECARALDPSMGMALVVRSLWSALNQGGVIPDKEMDIFDSWISWLSPVRHE